MSTYQNLTKRTRTQKDISSPVKNESRLNRLKQIDAIYKSQIQQIYSNQLPYFAEKRKEEQRDNKSSFSRKVVQTKNKTIKIGSRIEDMDNVSTSSRALHSVVSQDKLKSSKLISSDTTKTIDLLKLQNQSKQMKIKDLTNKCEYLLQKLRNHISVNQFSQEIESLNRLVQNKIQRFENLFKIKNEETFFKIKLQVVSLLQEFDIPKEELAPLNDVQTEASLLSFMSKKIKTQLKLFRSREQQNKFQLQKDKILSQKLQERLTYLTETNELLKLSQQKLKQKNESLKSQMHEFLQKMKQKQIQLQERDNQLFRIKRQSQQLMSSSSKIQQLQKKFRQQQEALVQKYQMKERELKGLLNGQNIEKQKLQSALEEKQSSISEMIIKEKYLSQQNQRINRQLLRTKERYEWCEKELQNKRKQYQDQKAAVLDEFKRYKQANNESILLYAKSQTDQAMRKIQEYQDAYSRLSLQLDQEKKSSQLKYQQYLNKLEAIQQTWLEKTKRLQLIREEQLQQIAKDYQEKHQQVRRQFEKKEKLVAEEMQGKMKALLAEKDKKYTQKLLEFQQENQMIKKQLEQQVHLNSLLLNKK